MNQFSFLSPLLPWLERLFGPASTPPIPAGSPANPADTVAPPSVPEADVLIAWGAKVTAAFKRKTIAIARRLEMDPSHLMAIMAFETGRTFDPAITNHAGSGATGLIQFMPATAKDLGTTTSRLALMNGIEQLDYVERYLRPYEGRIGDLASAYMAVLYPRAVDRPGDHVLFRKGSKAYKLNRGLDVNGNGHVTKAEAAAKVFDLLEEGLRPGQFG